MKILKIMAVLAAGCTLSACLTLSGNYEVKAYDDSGEQIKLPRFVAQGSGIYTAINALCSSFPQATVKVFNLDTGEEVKHESKRCR